MADPVVRAGHADAAVRLVPALQFQSPVEGRGHVGHRHPVLGALRPGQARDDGTEVEFQRVRIDGLAGAPPQPLRLCVRFDERHGLSRPVGQPQIVDGFPVHGKEPAGRSVFRRHVGDGRAVGQWQLIETVAEELHEFPDHAPGPQHFHHAQHQVRRRDAFGKPPGQPEPDYLGNQHGDRLAQHRGFGFDTADAPAEYAGAVDHGGVAVGADQGVGVGRRAAVRLIRPHHAGQVFQVDLVADPRAGRHDAEVVECGLAPAQEPVALFVALHLEFDVVCERLAAAEPVDHHRMVDDEIHRRQRVDDFRLEPRRQHGATHGGQVGHRRHAGEVLHQHPGRAIGDLCTRTRIVCPVGQAFDIGTGYRLPVLEPEQVLQQDLQRHGQARYGTGASRFRLGQAEIVVGDPLDGKCAPALEAV